MEERVSVVVMLLCLYLFDSSPHYFTKIKISAIALIKMVGDNEV
jgi:hypothetical protein